MKSSLMIITGCLTVVVATITVTNVVHCERMDLPGGKFFERIGSGVQRITQRARCRLHRVGNFLYKHQHENDPCHNTPGDSGDSGDHHHVSNADSSHQHHQHKDHLLTSSPIASATDEPILPTGVSTKYSTASSTAIKTGVLTTSTEYPLIDIRSGSDPNTSEDNSTDFYYIKSNANCSEGFIPDVHGICQQQY